MAELWNTLKELALVLGSLLYQVYQLAAPWLLAIAWVAWWLWAVDWRKMGPALRRGAWAPLTLLGLIAALAWAMVAPRSLNLLGWNVPNFWWQVGAVGLILSSALFCGWLQLRLRWSPPEIVLEPPAEHGRGGAHHHHVAAHEHHRGGHWRH